MGIDFRNKKNRPALSLLAAISVRGGPLLLMPARGGTVIKANETYSPVIKQKPPVNQAQFDKLKHKANETNSPAIKQKPPVKQAAP